MSKLLLGLSARSCLCFFIQDFRLEFTTRICRRPQNKCRLPQGQVPPLAVKKFMEFSVHEVLHLFSLCCLGNSFSFFSVFYFVCLFSVLVSLAFLLFPSQCCFFVFSKYTSNLIQKMIKMRGQYLKTEDVNCRRTISWMLPSMILLPP